jgi:hypothetical protein
MSKDDEDEEQAKREGRDEEEVDGHNISGMGGEKRAPRGRRSRRRPMHVPRDREFGDAVAEQGQFRPDAPAAPGGILTSHPTDQMANLRVELWPADRLGSGLPSPVELEAAAVPGEDGGGLHDGQAGPPSHPDAGQPDPEDPVPNGRAGVGGQSAEEPRVGGAGRDSRGRWPPTRTARRGEASRDRARRAWAPRHLT